QVFIAPEDDHLRTRLTHAVEVAQIAVGIARVANLCLPLVEAIALAHDCGHGPAGHASEEAFSPYLPETGYDHAVYGADVTLPPCAVCPGARRAGARGPPPRAGPPRRAPRGGGSWPGRPNLRRWPPPSGPRGPRAPPPRRPPPPGCVTSPTTAGPTRSAPSCT